jgi:hypothetical protein
MLDVPSSGAPDSAIVKTLTNALRAVGRHVMTGLILVGYWSFVYGTYVPWPMAELAAERERELRAASRR